jgi:hypothetical protein
MPIIIIFVSCKQKNSLMPSFSHTRTICNLFLSEFCLTNWIMTTTNLPLTMYNERCETEHRVASSGNRLNSEDRRIEPRSGNNLDRERQLTLRGHSRHPLKLATTTSVHIFNTFQFYHSMLTVDSNLGVQCTDSISHGRATAQVVNRRFLSEAA